jgi:serine/threonine-protein phosphatase CPPED1
MFGGSSQRKKIVAEKKRNRTGRLTPAARRSTKMKRLLNVGIVVATLGAITVFAVRSGANNPPADKPALVVAETAARNPWTKLELHQGADAFRFAVVSDRTGGHRSGIFSRAVRMINLLQPEFVMSVGDLIEGYSEDPGQWALEWSEFETNVDRLQMPFFFCTGNHDMSNVPMSENWKRKFGRSYYSFRFRNVLFVVLNSEEPRPKDQDYRFSPEQQEWLRQTLQQNGGVRWTFVFFHKPVWREAMGDPVAQGWTPIEDALVAGDRRYTVFVGHEHNYAKFVRHGREYFMLATTGGGSKMRGVDYGEFDHVAWVTMKNGQPVIANVLLDGVQPNDVRKERDLPRFPLPQRAPSPRSKSPERRAATPAGV